MKIDVHRFVRKLVMSVRVFSNGVSVSIAKSAATPVQVLLTQRKGLYKFAMVFHAKRLIPRGCTPLRGNREN